MESPSTSGARGPATTGAKGQGHAAAKSPKGRRKRLFQNLALFAFSSLIALLLGELVLRWAIFSGGPGFKNLQNPGQYYYFWDQDYWKMNYRVDTASKPPQHPHPYLGWTGDYHPRSYFHLEGLQTARRRPVLLYGDSFSACVEQSLCFQDILNADSAFAKDNFLLNYGVGGYGVCQASLLCRKTAPHYERPLVVFGILTTDIERTVLPSRTGQKPYYVVEDSQLVLQGLPIDSSAAHFYETHPMGTTSLLMRLFLRSRANFLPYRFTNWYLEKDKSIANIQAVNRLLIQQLARELRAMDIDFTFLIFHFEDDMMSPDSENNWHDQFLRKTLNDEKIPYIWSKDVIRKHRLAHPENVHTDYVIPGNGHPTTLYNELISAEIKRIALAQPRDPGFVPDSMNQNYYWSRIWALESSMRNDPGAVKRLQEKANANHLSIEEQIMRDAAFLMNQGSEADGIFGKDGVFDGQWRK